MRSQRREEVLNEKAYQILGFTLEVQQGMFNGRELQSSPKLKGVGRSLYRLTRQESPRVSARMVSKVGATKITRTGWEVLNLLNQVRSNIYTAFCLSPLQFTQYEYRIAIRMILLYTTKGEVFGIDVSNIYYLGSQQELLRQQWEGLSMQNPDGSLALSRFF